MFPPSGPSGFREASHANFMQGITRFVARTLSHGPRPRRADRRRTGPRPTRPPRLGTLTGKERLGRKWMDEQRIDNCNVPIGKRGSKPRPSTCPHVPIS